MSAPFNVGAFPGIVVDWAVVTDRDLVVADKRIVERVKRWVMVARKLHRAEDIIVMRDEFGHRFICVATRGDDQ